MEIIVGGIIEKYTSKINKEHEDTTFLIITFTTELLEEKISFNEKEILDVKWISKEE